MVSPNKNIAKLVLQRGKRTNFISRFISRLGYSKKLVNSFVQNGLLFKLYLQGKLLINRFNVYLEEKERLLFVKLKMASLKNPKLKVHINNAFLIVNLLLIFSFRLKEDISYLSYLTPQDNNINQENLSSLNPQDTQEKTLESTGWGTKEVVCCVILVIFFIIFATMSEPPAPPTPPAPPAPPAPDPALFFSTIGASKDTVEAWFDSLKE